jgi:hypothetical protein
LIKAGYSPDTSWVTPDVVNEEEKKKLICLHCEKLGIVCKTMNLSYGSTTPLTENLRICGNTTPLRNKNRKQYINKDVQQKPIGKICY